MEVNNRLIYIPSVDTGPLSAMLRKKETYNGKPFSWFDEGVPEKYRLKTFLISAGTQYKNPNYIDEFDFPNDMLVFGDSGGYQITTGVIEWSPEMQKTIFNWLENNSTVAANWDIPPRGKMEGKYDECLDISKKNFKYFHENQTGNTTYLNCLQGSTIDLYNHWYKNVKEFEFSGWAIGGPFGSYGVLAPFAVLLEHGELLKDNVKIVHYFGVSSIDQVILIEYLQKLLNDAGLNVQLMTDSSSPGLGSKYGLYYTGYDIKRGSFNTIHLPRKKDNNIYEDWIMPKLNLWDEYFFEDGWIDVENYKSPDYAAIALHNISIFKDMFDFVEGMIHTDEYFYQDLFGTDTRKYLEIAKKIFESNHPIFEFKKHANDLKGKNKNISQGISHNFFK